MEVGIRLICQVPKCLLHLVDYFMDKTKRTKLKVYKEWFQ